MLQAGPNGSVRSGIPTPPQRKAQGRHIAELIHAGLSQSLFGLQHQQLRRHQAQLTLVTCIILTLGNLC